MIPMDLSDAFVICRHNKIKALLPDDTRLILERHFISLMSFDTYHYTLNVKRAREKHYAASSFTAWRSLEDVLSDYHALPIADIWLPLEASFPIDTGDQHVTQ